MKQRDGQTDLICWFIFPNSREKPTLGQAEAVSWTLYVRLPLGWQRLRDMSLLLHPARIHVSRNSEPEAEQGTWMKASTLG